MTQVSEKNSESAEPAPEVAPASTSLQPEISDKSAIGVLSQWQLIRLGFARHTLAVLALRVLILLYLLAIFAEFCAPQLSTERNLDFQYCPPQLIRWTPSAGLHVEFKVDALASFVPI